ncbi:MAG: D-glycero-beta-D-manno-heptose 1,7-bisphosphate 7-phosphatase [Gammaproteobacteria bacterium]|nr:D-glycero-beta-D-manno-heptose 1,7-bisphosphate 7-phosphatase [Gammaproteobacteria bacterium]MDH4254672.1 D-glycero-beta-D-manno-heptose 1,7-bisphosphate 7-phosphatase [Gammaproteobacteria bacterium]MDH5310030.1 D-glycero-beta-D-manno-heptose 1,7-bisphosphate 7-phosphatase [Gammaproteobacteria bacterium]
MAGRLVVLDRDGVINRDSPEFVKSPDEWIPLEGSLEAIALLTRSGYAVAVASNQSGLARGLFDTATLGAIHDKMRDAAAGAGGRIDRVVFCPHGPDAGCECRKPAPGLLLRLGRRYGIDLRGVPCIGDSERDLVAARSVGARPILVRSGNGRRTEALLRDRGEDVEVYDDLLAASRQLASEVGPA